MNGHAVAPARVRCVPGATIISALVASSPSTSATRRELPDAAQRALQRRLQDQLVAGLDRAAEARLVDADEVQRALLVRVHAGGDEGEDARGLRQRFEDHHARHHRPMREVAREERLVDRDVLERADRLARHALEHAIHQQEGIAMRQPAHHLVDVHRQRLGHRLPFVTSARHSVSSGIVRLLRPRRVSRRTCARQLVQLVEARRILAESRRLVDRHAARNSSPACGCCSMTNELAGHDHVVADRQMPGDADHAADHAALRRSSCCRRCRCSRRSPCARRCARCGRSGSGCRA